MIVPMPGQSAKRLCAVCDTKDSIALSALHRVREALIRDRIGASNQIHGFLLEFGISRPVGSTVIKRLPATWTQPYPTAPTGTTLERLHAHYKHLDEQVSEIEKEWRLQ